MGSESLAELMELADDSLEAVNAAFYERKWGDGLPIVPPTPKRVEAMLQYTDLPADHNLGKMPPRWGPTIVHYVAINAVMAGCRPEYFPVVIAGVQAVLEPDFNLYGVQGTTNPCGVMLVVNGPIARELEINSGYNLFGQGWWANSTIGRAIRLCLINIGGGLPGLGDMSTLGNPNKYGSCIAEYESASPWEPLHVERGFAADTSTVTVVGCTSPQNVLEISGNGADILRAFGTALQATGGNCQTMESEMAIVVSPVYAKHIARDGFDKPKMRQFIWEQSRLDMAGMSDLTRATVKKWKPNCVRIEDGREILYVTETPATISIIVGGGDAGPHAAVMPTFNGTKLVTKSIARADGTALASVHDILTR